MLGNRAIYHNGWKAIVNHSRNASGGGFEDDAWELYHVAKDYSECHNVAQQYPEKVKALERLWLMEASAAGVFPLLNGTLFGSKEEAANLIRHVWKNERFEEYENIIEPVDILRTFFSELNNKSHVVSADIQRDSKEQEGVIFSLGNGFAGYSLYVLNNRLKFTYNAGGIEFYSIESKEELPTGKVNVECRLKVHKDFTATAELHIGGVTEGTLSIKRLNSNSDPIATIGANKYTSIVPDDYEVPFAFSGKLNKVRLFIEGHTSDLGNELYEFFYTD